MNCKNSLTTFEIFSPNNDGVKDFTVFTVKADNELVLFLHLQKIENKETINTLKLSEKESKGEYLATWDGYSKEGNKVEDGEYNVIVYQKNKATSITARIKIDTAPPDSPNLLSPSNGIKIEEGAISFFWEEVEDVSYYQLEYSMDSKFTGEKFSKSDILFNYRED